MTIPKSINEIIDDNMSYPSKDLMVGNNNFLTEFASDSCHNLAKVLQSVRKVGDFRLKIDGHKLFTINETGNKNKSVCTLDNSY